MRPTTFARDRRCRDIEQRRWDCRVIVIPIRRGVTENHLAIFFEPASVASSQCNASECAMGISNLPFRSRIGKGVSFVQRESDVRQMKRRPYTHHSRRGAACSQRSGSRCRHQGPGRRCSRILDRFIPGKARDGRCEDIAIGKAAGQMTASELRESCDWCQMNPTVSGRCRGRKTRGPPLDREKRRLHS